jgi:F-type H+-transporting ATPase subunit alpha
LVLEGLKGEIFLDVGQSVSRVGGKAQLPAYRTVARDLRLSYTELRSKGYFL